MAKKHRSRACYWHCFHRFAKAFDTIYFAILLKKLKYYCVSDVELKWFTSYLHGRIQTVIIDDNISDSLPVTVGVPQGSTLRPLLFTLYVNELPKVAKNCPTSMYADDTELEHATNPQDIQLMKTINNDFDKLQNYFESNKLSLNVPKYTCVLVGTQQSLAKCNEINIKIGNESIPQATKSKHLGMQLENTLRWNAHIDQLVKKLSSKVGILRRL